MASSDCPNCASSNTVLYGRGRRCLECGSFFRPTVEKDPLQRKKKSRNEERKIAKDTRGRRHSGSGAFDTPGDGSCSAAPKDKVNFLVESKMTGHNSFSVTPDLMKKVYTEALLQSKTPILVVNTNGTRHVVLRYEDFLRIFDWKEP